MTENGDFDFPIHRAVWYADLERLSQLLCDEEIKTQVNDFDHHGNTPLHIAAHFGDVEAVNLLLENGADVNKYSSAGWYSSDEAIASGAKTILRRLIMVCSRGAQTCS